MICFLKLITGEELIAEVSGESQELTLKNPVRIGLTGEGLAMMPFSPFLKNDHIVLQKEHVLFTAEPDDEIRNAYNSKFGSGIVLARGQILSP